MRTEDLLKEYYRKIAPYHDKIFHGDTEGEFFDMDQYLLDLLRKWCPQNAGTILEVGCGTGYWLNHITGKNTRVVGVDLSPEMLKVAKNQLNKKVELYQGDVCSMDFLDDHSSDFTCCLWVLQYLVSKNRFRKGLKEVARVTKPGGIIFIAEDSPPTKPPFTDCLVEKDELGGIYFYEDQYEGMTLPVYRRLLSPPEMSGALTEQGVNLVKIEQKLSLKVYVACLI